jgi:hypothetical protein
MCRERILSLELWVKYFAKRDIFCVRQCVHTHTHTHTHKHVHRKGHLGQSGRNAPAPEIQKVGGAAVLLKSRKGCLVIQKIPRTQNSKLRRAVTSKIQNSCP